MGIDGRIYPVSAMPERRGARTGEMDFMDEWYPIQVKQTAKVGRPDIDSFEAVMIREERMLGYFVGFDFTGMPSSRSTGSDARKDAKLSRWPCAKFWMKKSKRYLRSKSLSKPAAPLTKKHDGAAIEKRAETT